VIRITRSGSRRPRTDRRQPGLGLETASASIEALLAAGVTLEFVEQPLPAWDLAGHAELRRRWGTPIVLDESVFTIHDLRRAIDCGRGDIVNIKLAKCGGIHAGLAIAREGDRGGARPDGGLDDGVGTRRLGCRGARRHDQPRRRT